MTRIVPVILAYRKFQLIRTSLFVDTVGMEPQMDVCNEAPKRNTQRRNHGSDRQRKVQGDRVEASAPIFA